MTLILQEPYSTGITRNWKLSKVIIHEFTAFQEVLIALTDHGMTLFCDSERQSSALSQLVYHEFQVLPAVCYAKKFGRALVIGSSEGVVPLMLETVGFQEIDHVDIDQECVQLCAEFLPYGYTQEDVENFSDAANGQSTIFQNKIKLFFEDGHKFVQRAPDGHYDVIVMDLPDANEENHQHNELYSKEFLALVKSKLSKEGAFITQAGNPALWRNSTLLATRKVMHEVFEFTEEFVSDEQDWSWIVGRNSPMTLNYDVGGYNAGYFTREVFYQSRRQL